LISKRMVRPEHDAGRTSLAGLWASSAKLRDMVACRA
jgi:hypothetical protein